MFPKLLALSLSLLALPSVSLAAIVAVHTNAKLDNPSTPFSSTQCNSRDLIFANAGKSTLGQLNGNLRGKLAAAPSNLFSEGVCGMCYKVTSSASGQSKSVKVLIVDGSSSEGFEIGPGLYNSLTGGNGAGKMAFDLLDFTDCESIN